VAPDVELVIKEAWTRVYGKLEKTRLTRFVAADEKVLNADMKL
jgi:hypothetical protein